MASVMNVVSPPVKVCTLINYAPFVEDDVLNVKMLWVSITLIVLDVAIINIVLVLN